MNKNWQLYTDTRNNEMMELQQQLEEAKRHNEGMSMQLSVQQQEKMDQLFLQYKQKADMAEEARLKVRTLIVYHLVTYTAAGRI